MTSKYQQWQVVLAQIRLDGHARFASFEAANSLVYREFPSTCLLCGQGGDSGHTMVV